MTDDDRPRFLRELRPLPQPRSFVAGTVSPGEAEAYAKAAFNAEVANVVGAVESTRNDTLNIAAFNLAQLVASGHLRREDVWNALYDAGLQAGLTERETRATLASGFRAGTAEPRDVPERPPGAPGAPLSDREDASGAFPRAGEGTEGEGEAEDGPLVPLPEPLNWHHLYEQEDEEEEWIVKPIIPARRLVALYSPAKAGKSLLMLEVAVGVSRGSTVLDYTPERPRRVLYVDLENDPRGDIRTRLQQMGFKPADLDNLIYLSFPDLPMLDTPMGALVLLDWIARFDCEVVVIDTVSRVVGGEENDNNTWLAFYRHTGKLLKANGTTCIRLDHTGKDAAKGMRGGSAKYSDVDLVWSLTTPGESKVLLECTAQRLPVLERRITLTRQSDPWLHHVVAGEGRAVAWRAEADDTIGFLDSQAGEDVHLTYAQAKAILQPAGRGKRKQDLLVLLRARNKALNERGLAFDPDPEDGS